MSKPIILTSGDIRTFGERRAPLPRRKAYVFSIDAGFSGTEVRVNGPAYRAAMQGNLRGPSPAFAAGLIYHVQDEVLIRSADDKVREIPQEAVLERATVSIVGSPTGGADLQARILAIWQDEAFISLDVSGVLYPGGALLRLWNDRSSSDFSDTVQTQIAIATECESAKFRWLVRNQLFGWGRMQLTREDGVVTAQFTYDVYSMAG